MLENSPYHESLEDEIPKDASVRLITEPGVYDISDGPTGVSRVRLIQLFDTKEADELLAKLIANLHWMEMSNEQKGVKTIEPRLISYYGENPYTYWAVTHEPSTQWPEVLLEIKKRVKECIGFDFNSVLGNYYRNAKDHVVWHSDDEKDLGINPVIASLSFGEPRSFELRKIPAQKSRETARTETLKVPYTEFIRMPLAHGSLLVMEGCMQTDWQHRIPIESRAINPRVNLTYRNINR